MPQEEERVEIFSWRVERLLLGQSWVDVQAFSRNNNTLDLPPKQQNYRKSPQKVDVFFFGRWTFIPLFFFFSFEFFLFWIPKLLWQVGQFQQTPFRIKSNAKPYLPNATRSKRWILQKRRSNVVWYTVWIYCTNILALMLVMLRYPLLGCLCWKLWRLDVRTSFRVLGRRVCFWR